MEITQERAISILARQVEISNDLLGESVKGIKVGGISYEQPDGSPWTYESGDEYAIVNLRAMSTQQLDEAAELIEQGEYEEAVRRNLSISLPVERARTFQTGELVKGTFDTYFKEDEDGNEREIIICTNIVKQESVTARPNRFARAKAKAKDDSSNDEATAEAKAKTEPAETK